MASDLMLVAGVVALVFGFWVEGAVLVAAAFGLSYLR